MKIALVRKDFINGHGGAERYAVGLAHGLVERGHAVHVFAGRADRDAAPGATVHLIPYYTRPSFLKNLSFPRAVRAELAGRQFDIVNGLSQVFPQDVYRLGDGLHVHWMRLHTPNPLKRFLKRLTLRHRAILAIEREIFREGNYRRVIANSQLCADQLTHYYGVPRERISLVYNGVDSAQFNPAVARQRRAGVRARFGIAGRTLALLFAGHNFRRKGLQFALQAASGLRSAGIDVHVLVAGRGRPGPYRTLARRLGLDSSVTFCGPADDMPGLFSAADLLVHPALYDPFSNVCLEAMACGVPVLTSRQNGASEIIEHLQSGFVVERPWDIEAMVASVLALGGDVSGGLQAAGENAAARARALTPAANVTQTLAAYEEVLREGAA